VRTVTEATHSVCPVCLRQVPAQRVASDGKVFLEKECPSHGRFSAVVWNGQYPIEQWIGSCSFPDDVNPKCPTECGLCASHLQKTCCVLLEVTRRCNLQCPFCFADGGRDIEPSFEHLRLELSQLAVPGETLVQLSGGEPTMRDDLPIIVAAARKAGCKYVQLNTNGLRLAADPEYVRLLADAGLSFVFLQFDGTEDAIYQQLRGRPLLKLKRRAIDNCASCDLGVTLVPTLVPGINVRNIGEILRFAVAQSPSVRGVHFQPVSYFGRIPAQPKDDLRLTLDQLLTEIELQTDGEISVCNLLPSSCDHPLCGFHGDFVVDNGKLFPLTVQRETTTCCCKEPRAAEKNREFVARRWQRSRKDEAACCGSLRDMESFLAKVRSHGFTVTAMAFQDAGNLDLQRLRQCSLHVYHGGRLVPFCSYYLTRWCAI